MLLLATGSIARTLHRHTRNVTEHDAKQRSISQHDPKQQRKLLRLQKNVPQQQLEFSNVISYWDDIYTFFTPDLATVSATYQNRSHTPCPWTYVLDHDFNRHPQYIYQAHCDPSNNYLCQNTDQAEWSECTCQHVEYNIPVRKRINCDSTTGEQHWVISNEIVYGACVPRFN